MIRTLPKSGGCVPALIAMITATAVASQKTMPPVIAVAGGIPGASVAVDFETCGLADLQIGDAAFVPAIPLPGGETVALELQRIDAFAPDAKLVVMTAQGELRLPRPDVVLLTGTVVDDVDSRVFLALANGQANGWLNTNGRELIVSSGPIDGAQPTLIYDPATLPDGLLEIAPFTCATDELGIGVINPATGSASTSRSDPCRVATLAIETDYEFTQTFGGDTNASGAYVASLIGAVSEIYQAQINTRLVIGYLRLWTTSNDPWTQGSTSDQLFQFQDYWNANMTSIDRNAAHFLTTRGLGGGVAYVGALCFPEYDYGLSANLNAFFPYPLQDNSPDNWDLMVTAHELGHNFGAPHTHSTSPQIDNCAGGDCSVTPHGTIMSYCHLCPGGLANIELRFHERIKDEEIRPFLTALEGDGWCDLQPANVSISDQPDDAVANPGDNVAFSVVAANGAAPYGYVWKHNGTTLVDGGNVSGATTATLTLANVAGIDEGNYTVTVSDDCGNSVTSRAAALTVTTPLCDGDVNGDSAVDFADFSALGSCWGQPCGDVTGDATTDFDDFSMLTANWGCGL